MEYTLDNAFDIDVGIDVDVDIDLDHLIECQSPIKRPSAPLPQPQRLSPTKDLFQITNNHNYKSYNLFGVEDTFPDLSLKNNKIEKLIRDLEAEDYELDVDTQARSRIFKGRIKGLEDSDEFDARVASFIDKENIDFEPTKSPIRTNKVKKPLKPLRQNSSKVPVLKPLNSPMYTSFTPVLKAKDDLHKRVCRPSHRQVACPPPVLAQGSPHHPQIYLVDASTGSLSDATQFGTELNASNCEGFPLPETVHEVVQIPTNDESGRHPPKMAIIKTFECRMSTPSQPPPAIRPGFYSKTEYLNYIQNLHATQQEESGVEVVSQAPAPTNRPPRRRRHVAFADSDALEW
ncbi:hypothetical protein PSN45_000185 [Yamadazyma tenuis]|uniref:Uncharacterized protein n=1 Tax=Candida tenuis (strain ATCC 10573 / BCRC 21748 / CBS 615 / JCM 9827 / NBRC 10315 / NRRL Y-1498 / VKM Y-70) TaxID=590646 RepID=G3BB81_CANTC|nr:uncharacterized protein CANTEDRAFT_94402 [Yamadazyma tenuis ATCC 10573]EGV61511.1 hypothetical protein CANTEDRAFT_94402 [Yamadazyma tenuis ATCC 10573]WEJ92730.1 hypothetical protein PSN45_000185 [Yamadazyma tenuis]